MGELETKVDLDNSNDRESQLAVCDILSEKSHFPCQNEHWKQLETFKLEQFYLWQHSSKLAWHLKQIFWAWTLRYWVLQLRFWIHICTQLLRSVQHCSQNCRTQCRLAADRGLRTLCHILQSNHRGRWGSDWSGPEVVLTLQSSQLQCQVLLHPAAPIWSKIILRCFDMSNSFVHWPIGLSLQASCFTVRFDGCNHGIHRSWNIVNFNRLCQRENTRGFISLGCGWWLNFSIKTLQKVNIKLRQKSSTLG